MFDRASRPYPWDLFVDRHLAHCWVFWSRYIPQPGPLSQRITLKSEATPGGIYQDVALVDPETILAQVLAAGPTDVLALTVLVQRHRLRYFGALSCVSVVKAALNIHAPYCWTPTQLHRRLVMMGARSLLGDPHP